MRLFLERGFDTVTVDELAAEAGVSRRTFFRYFPSKDAVLFVTTPARLAGWRALNLPRPGDGGPLDPIRRACDAIAREYMTKTEYVLMRRKILESSPTLMRIEGEVDRSFEAAIEAGLLAWYEDPSSKLRGEIAIFAAAVFGGIRATMGHWFASEGRRDLVRMASEGLDFFARGLVLPPRTATTFRTAPPLSDTRSASAEAPTSSPVELTEESHP